MPKPSRPPPSFLPLLLVLCGLLSPIKSSAALRSLVETRVGGFDFPTDPSVGLEAPQVQEGTREVVDVAEETRRITPLTQDTYLGQPGEPPSLNRYLYGYGNPGRWIDPTGHASLDTEIDEGALRAAKNDDKLKLIGWSALRGAYEIANVCSMGFMRAHDKHRDAYDRGEISFDDYLIGASEAGGEASVKMLATVATGGGAAIAVGRAGGSAVLQGIAAGAAAGGTMQAVEDAFAVELSSAEQYATSIIGGAVLGGVAGKLASSSTITRLNGMSVSEGISHVSQKLTGLRSSMTSGGRATLVQAESAAAAQRVTVPKVTREPLSGTRDVLKGPLGRDGASPVKQATSDAQAALSRDARVAQMRAKIEANIAESRAARDASGFKDWSQGVSAKRSASVGSRTGLGDASTSPWLADSRAGVVSHLEQFRGGGSWLMTRKQYDWFVKGKSVIGDPSGQFITTHRHMDKVFDLASGNVGAIEHSLGFAPGHFSSGGGLVRINIRNPLMHKARMPSGMERGANEYFRWGGYTSGKTPEAVIDPLPASSASIEILVTK